MEQSHDTTMQPISIRLRPELAAALRQLAEAQECSVAAIIRRAAREHVERSFDTRTRPRA